MIRLLKQRFWQKRFSEYELWVHPMHQAFVLRTIVIAGEHILHSKQNILSPVSYDTIVFKENIETPILHKKGAPIIWKERFCHMIVKFFTSKILHNTTAERHRYTFIGVENYIKSPRKSFGFSSENYSHWYHVSNLGKYPTEDSSRSMFAGDIQTTYGMIWCCLPWFWRCFLLKNLSAVYVLLKTKCAVSLLNYPSTRNRISARLYDICILYSMRLINFWEVLHYFRYTANVNLMKVHEPTSYLYFPLNVFLGVLRRTQSHFSRVADEQYIWHKTASKMFVALLTRSELCRGVNLVKIHLQHWICNKCT